LSQLILRSRLLDLLTRKSPILARVGQFWVSQVGSQDVADGRASVHTCQAAGCGGEGTHRGHRRSATTSGRPGWTSSIQDDDLEAGESICSREMARELRLRDCGLPPPLSR